MVNATMPAVTTRRTRSTASHCDRDRKTIPAAGHRKKESDREDEAGDQNQTDLWRHDSAVHESVGNIAATATAAQ